MSGKNLDVSPKPTTLRNISLFDQDEYANPFSGNRSIGYSVEERIKLDEGDSNLAASMDLNRQQNGVPKHSQYVSFDQQAY